jgi:hypothetical protein
MKKLLLAVALVVGLCGGAFGAEVPRISLNKVTGNAVGGIVDISDFSTTKTVKGLDPDHDITFEFRVESESSEITVSITTTTGTSEEYYGPVTRNNASGTILDSYTTSFSPGQSKEIRISARTKDYFVPSLGYFTGGMIGTLKFTAEAKMVADVPGTPVTDFDLKVGPSGTPAKRVSVELKANQGDTCQLTPVVYPDNAANKKVTWSTSDSAVASVDSTGKVTGKAAGSAVITAWTENGSFKATCDVTVVADTSTPPSGGGSGPDGSGGSSDSDGDGGGGGGCNAGFLGMTLLLAAAALKKR